MKYDDMLRRVNLVTDKLGKGVDPGIKHAVVAFNMAGFPTTMSCEGHMKKWGAPFPWVDIESNSSIKENMLLHLSIFYSNRDRDLLSLKMVGGPAYFRIQSSNEAPCGGLVDSYIRDEVILLAARKEMDAFADYLLESQ